MYSVYYSDQIWPIFIFNSKPSNGLVPLKLLTILWTLALNFPRWSLATLGRREGAETFVTFQEDF
jgi:hypothetical protein